MRVAALVLTLGLAGDTGDQRGFSLADEWIRLVEQHAAGENDEPIAALSRWTLRDLDAAQPFVNALMGVPLSTEPRRRRRRALSVAELSAIRHQATQLKGRTDIDRFRKRAVMLHTDAALFGSFQMTVDQPVAAGLGVRNRFTRRVDVMSQDGKVQQFQLANPHWDYARDLLASLPKGPHPDPMVATWYRAIGAHFMMKRSFAEAVDHFDSAREVVADAPDVLYGEACLQEIFGAPRIQDYAAVAMRQGVVILGVSSAQAHFKRAADMLRKALVGRPDFLEARLRLGRLLVEQKQYDAAINELGQVVQATEDRALRYYGLIFTGDALLSLDRAAEARAAFEQALAVYPRAQAARIGLAAAFRTMSDRQSAVQAVMATMSLPGASRGGSDEPWWNYYDGDEGSVDRLLAELRASFRASPQ